MIDHQAFMAHLQGCAKRHGPGLDHTPDCPPWAKCPGANNGGPCPGDLFCLPSSLPAGARLPTPWPVYEFACNARPRHRYAAPRGKTLPAERSSA